MLVAALGTERRLAPGGGHPRDGGAAGGAGRPSPAAAAAAQGVALPGPRASAEEVRALLRAAPPAVQKRVLEAYQEFVPLHPAIDNAYAAVLHVARTLPRLIDAAGASGGGACPYATCARGPRTTGVGAALAESTAADAAQLRRIKRDLCFHARSDESIDRRQLATNQVVYVLSRRMGLAVETPPDIDALLPRLRVAIRITDDGPTEVQQTGRQQQQQQQQQHHLSECQATLEQLLMERFSPHARLASRELPGVAAANRKALEARGWRAVDVPLPLIEAAAGGPAGLRAAAGGGRARDGGRIEAAYRKTQELLSSLLRPLPRG